VTHCILLRKKCEH